MTVGFHDVLQASQRIAQWAHRTPIITCSAINQIAGRKLVFKCEQFQKVGAFKFRGAINAVKQLSANDASRGVVTHSSGNHAQALALAAKLCQIPAYIVMPSNSSLVKIAAVKEYGANVTLCEPTQTARESTAAKIQAETGGVFVHPYDDDAIIAGQGTAALELWEDAGPLDAIIAPVGGGGLISGTCAAVSELTNRPRIFAAEPIGADDACRSKLAGERLPQTNPNTICDGLRTGLGERNWPFVRDSVEQVITVTDDATVSAMRLLWERAKLLVEPSSATVLAAVLSDSFRDLKGIESIGLILSGGNVALDQLP